MFTSSGEPMVCPDANSLDLLELVRSGAYRPEESGALSLPLALPAAPAVASVTLIDAEGVPLVQLPLDSLDGRHRGRLQEMPSWLGHLSARPFEDLYRTPREIHASLRPDATVILVDRPLASDDLVDYESGAPLLLMVLSGPSTDPRPQTLLTLRSAREVAAIRRQTEVVAVPMDATSWAAQPGVYAAVLNSYAPQGYRRLRRTSAPTAGPGGLVVFFTGLSGSGKSTIARALQNVILEQCNRSVSLLDGDVVRHHLTAGLGFSPADRATNVRRIGWVAAQIARHQGIAICSPIAPYRAGREEVREMVRHQGGHFVLIHVATPLSVCEQRDRKGLYARARAGAVADFTGITAPYESPTDADLVVDTSSMTVEQAQRRVMSLLTSQRLLELDVDG